MPQAVRRLPGARFEAYPPASPEVLPRMDIAGFVGFASSGPIDVPVPVEDAAQFAQVFGADAPLAWDPDRGEETYAHLGPAVRAFFRNGGRRCWVVRVADRDAAATDLLPLPGLAAVAADGDIAPAALCARSPGSWADALRVSASLEPTPLRLHVVSSPTGEFEALVAGAGDVVAGDLIRVSLPDGEWTLVFAVASAHVGERVPAEGISLARVALGAGPSFWIRATSIAPGQTGQLYGLHGHAAPTAAAASTAPPRAGDADELVRVSFEAPADAAPPPGTLLRVVFGTDELWLDVADVDAAPDGSLAAVGTLFEISRARPAFVPDPAPDGIAERLTLSLAVESPDGVATLGGLGFAALHPRFAATLPSDDELYGDPAAVPAPATLAFAAAQPRFPLAGPERRPELLLPLGVSILAGPALPAIRPAGTGLVRDGLASFDTALFVDDALAASPAETLLDDAFWIRDQQPRPRPLRGIHALFAIDEVTLVAIPDAVQRGWSLGSGPRVGRPDPPPPTEEPDWARFLDCTTRITWAPVLMQLGDEETGMFTLEWKAVAHGADRHAAVATGWSNPERAFAAYGDGSSATATPGANETISGDFGFPALDLPLGSTIDRVSLVVEWAMTADAGATLGLVGLNDGVADTAAEVTKTMPEAEQSVFTFDTAPTRDDLAAAGRVVARLRCSTGNTAVPVSGNVDAVRIEVAYTPPPPGHDDVADRYELRQAIDPKFETAGALYEGPEREFRVYGRPQGSTLYYEVRALSGGRASVASNRLAIQTTQASRWFVEEAAGYSADDLRELQRALLRMCAARGDLFALLALPEHYREPEAIAYAHALKHDDAVRAFEPDPVFSFGALYHPWLYTSDPGDPTVFRMTPPDGAAAGVLAARAATRGAWVAPANEPLRDVVQLDPPIRPEAYQAFQDAQLNLVRHEPAGFLWLAADTLSDDPDLRPVGVRRLLQVLRRAAVLHGAAYAFEPNDETFRRTVQRAFEGLLSQMYSLGAFAGSAPGEGFRVNTGSPPNTPASVDAGRLIVEIQVAPARPLAFLTVRLVRTGEGALSVEAQ
jgi:hypothetical protein